MASQGKSRRARPSYTSLFTKVDSEEESEESSASDQNRQRDGSIFELASESAKNNSREDVASEDSFEADMELLVEERDEASEDDIIVDTAPKKKSKRGKGEVKKPQEGPDIMQSLPNGIRPQRPAPKGTMALPAKDHRHRPGSLWCPPSGVTRLATKPDMFSAPNFLPTTSTDDPAIAHRVKKAWMYCISAGPCWELLEDRGFYKEEYTEYRHSSRSSRVQRPLVYTNLPSAHNLSEPLVGQVAKYLPPTTFLECNFGPFGSQTLHKFVPLSSISMRSFRDGDAAEVIFVGGPVTAIDWCPSTEARLAVRAGKLYLAVATLVDPSEPVKTGLSSQNNTTSSIQIWSFSPSEEAGGRQYPKTTCESVLCIDEGNALQLKWCPLPSHDIGKHGVPKVLGLLAVVTMNRTVGIYRVPEPTIRSKKGTKTTASPSYIKISPIFCLSLPEAACLTIEWANSEIIAVGCSNGFIAVFDIKSAVLEETEPALTHYFPVHQTAIQSVSWIRAPQIKGDGSAILDDDPAIICSTGAEGVVKLTDIRDCIPRLLVRNREVPHASVYSSFCGSLLATDVDFWVKLFQIQAASLGKGHFMIDVGGAAMAISVSDLHPILAVGSADGACTTTNMLRGVRREGAVPILNHRIYQLDYNPTTGHYRMLDHLLPRESGSSEGPSYTDSAAKAKATSSDGIKERFEKGAPEPSGLWPTNIGVSAVAWNSGCGLACAPWLASGMACGLVRVDYVEGGWMRNVLPYGSVEAIRREVVDDGIESASE